MMKKLLGWVFNPWLMLLVGLLALALLIWIVGPMIAVGELRPLQSEAARWTAIGLIVLLLVLRKAWQAWRARRTNANVVDQLLTPAPAAPNGPADAELKVLNERFAGALQALKKARFDQGKRGLAGAVSAATARFGKRYLYELPWYVIVGAPGSGKTTALLNSGLHFPLAAAVGDKPVRGVAGTRNCDWWFTDEAVLIDTAGRYTTQDSDPGGDAQAWQGFLGLLKRSRPRQPLNGVLVTVSVSDLLMRNAAARASHAALVRQRVQELHQHLGMRFPIYLLVTKCDLLAGFMETLGDIDKEHRATPWGMTFALDKNQHSDLAAFDAEFELLEKRLNDGLIERLQLERDVPRRARIYAFPQQFEALRGLLKDFIEQVFSASQFEARPLLRGVYFVSGTQEGTPIDRMLGRIARSYRLEQALLPPLQASGKSFFLSRLLKEVVFAESALAGTDLKWERRRHWLALGAYSALAALGIGAFAVWGTSYLNNRRYVEQVRTTVEQVNKLVRATPNRATPDLLVLLPALEATRDLGRTGIGDSVPWSHGFGLYQGAKLDAAAKQAYHRMLVDAMLPRLALGIEEQLKGAADNPELQYEALKAYLMLYAPAHFDAKALKDYVLVDWQLNLPRSVTTEQRAALSAHLDALLAAGPAVSPIAEDKTLVAQTRARLLALSLAERIYRRLKRQGVGSDVAEFTLAKAAGPGAPLAFARASGAPLTQGVPGLFTYDGYHKGLQRELERVSKQLAEEEPWVLGLDDASRQRALTEADVQQQLTDTVRRLYLNDYARIWEEFIADIRMLPAGNMQQAVQLSRVLSAPDNPLVPLLKALSHQTTLGDTKDMVSKVESKARDMVQRSREELARLLGGQAAPSALAPGARIESIVDDRFAALRQMVNAPDGKGAAPIDGTVALINEVYTLLVAADSATTSGNAPPSSDVPNKVKAEAARLPEPLRSLLNTLSVSGTKAAQEIARTNIGSAMNAEIGEFCRQAIGGRYPFQRNSPRDVTQEDFARLFAPGGLFDSFFQKNLSAQVDVSTKPWSYKKVDGVAVGGDSVALAQFQRAAVIRDTFFRAGGNAPGLRLDFKPAEMDAAITQFILDVDGQILKYAHGPQISTPIQWPGPRGASQLRIALTPVSASGTSGLVKDGPWALFRLFDSQEIDSTGVPEKFRATFNIDGRKAVFDVTASSVRNPFRLNEMAEFSCPGR